MSQYQNIESLLDRSTQYVGKEEFADHSPDYLDDDILYIRELDKIPSIDTTRVYANIIIACGAGSMDVVLGGERCTLEAGEILVCPSDSVIERPMVSPDFKFTMIAFTDNMLHELLSQNMDIWNKAVYIRKGHIIKPCDDRDREMVREGGMHMLELTRLILSHRELAFRREMIRSLLQVILLAYCSIQREMEITEKPREAERPRQIASTTIFNNFLALLRQEKKKHRPVGYYADLLFITPKHLSFVCKQVSGKTATEIIQAAVTEEIVQLLRNSDYTVKQISQQLQFPNISFFGKFVKKHLGLSPNDYRRQMTSRK